MTSVFDDLPQCQAAVHSALKIILNPTFALTAAQLLIFNSEREVKYFRLTLATPTHIFFWHLCFLYTHTTYGLMASYIPQQVSTDYKEFQMAFQDWTGSEKSTVLIGLSALVVGILACVAAIVVIPEVRQFLNLDAGRLGVLEQPTPLPEPSRHPSPVTHRAITIMETLPSFIGALGLQWATYICLFLLAMGIFLRFYKNNPNHKIAFLSTAPFLLLSCFLVWHGEHVELQGMKAELERVNEQHATELKRVKEQAVAKLNGRINELIVGEGQSSKGTQVFVRLALENIGPQSFAVNYSLVIEKNPEIDVKIPGTDITDEYALIPVGKTKSVMFQAHDSLAGKTAQPILAGGKVQGWLRFNLADAETPPDFIYRPGVKYSVCFNSIYGKTCSAPYVIP